MVSICCSFERCSYLWSYFWKRLSWGKTKHSVQVFTSLCTLGVYHLYWVSVFKYKQSCNLTFHRSTATPNLKNWEYWVIGVGDLLVHQIILIQYYTPNPYVSTTWRLSSDRSSRRCQNKTVFRCWTCGLGSVSSILPIWIICMSSEMMRHSVS